MIASGPPSAMFDNSATTSTTGGFSSAMRFGSLGPKIYDYAMVSIPYSTSQLDDTKQVNASIPKFYLDNATGSLDWTAPVWDTSTNGTNATLLAGNYSHFAGDISAWQTLMGNNTCITNASNFNATNPCYVDTTDHRIWLRIPHFSGIDPSIAGSVVATSSSTAASSASSSTGTANPSTSKSNSFVFDKIIPGEAVVMKNLDELIGIKEIEVNVKSQANSVKIVLTKYSSKPAEISVNKTGKVYQYIHIDTTNLLSSLDRATVTFMVNKTWANDNSLSPENISVYKFNETSDEWMPLSTIYDGEDANNYYYNVTVSSFSYFAISQKLENVVVAGNESGVSNNSGSPPVGPPLANTSYWWLVALAILIIAGIVIYFLTKKR